MNGKVKEFFTAKKILIILVIISCILIASSFFSNKLVSPLKEAVSSVLVPLQKGMNNMGLGVVNKREKAKTISALLKENEELEKKIEVYENENRELREKTHELDDLKKLYKLDTSLKDYPKVAANIIGGAVQNWNTSLMLDRGSADGITLDMNVISDGGLVGIITEVHNNYSIATTIISDTSYVSAIDETSKDQCTVKGDISLLDSSRLKLERIKAKANIKNGDRIMTSNISSKYLPNILIGYATDISLDKNELSKSGYLKPAVDFEHLQRVLIITKTKGAT